MKQDQPINKEIRRNRLVNAVVDTPLHHSTDEEVVNQRLPFDDETFRHFIENTPAAIALFDINMKYLITSKRWIQEFKMPDTNLAGKYAFDGNPPLPPSWKTMLRDVTKTGIVIRLDEELFVDSEDQEHWLQWEMHPWFQQSGQIKGSIVFVEFITEKKKANVSDQVLVEQQARLASKIETIEEERRKISRELHDSIGQMLTAAHLNLELLEDAIAEGGNNATRVIQKIRKLLDATIQETRNISYNLRPAILDDFGLIPGLRLLTEDFTEATGINVIFQYFNFDDRIDPKLDITIYRICQEALNNIARHSRASQATIELFRKKEHLLISINDNGVGIPDDHRDDKHFRAGSGLNNIKERVELHGGELNIRSQKNSGTELIIRIPLTSGSRS